MATYHCSLKQGKVGTALAHSNYIRREGKYALDEKKEELEYSESGNLPYWAADAKAFFAAADLYERKNGTAYAEFELALPNELSLEENIQLVREFVQRHIGPNKVYSFAIHDKNATLDPSQRQPHVHLMFSERIITDKENVKPAELFFKRYNAKNPERGGYQKDNRFTAANGIRQQNIKEIRAAWAEQVNAAYAAKGLDLRVTEKSLRSQRIEAFMKNDPDAYESASRPAEQHLGPKEAYRVKEILAKGGFSYEELGDRARLNLIAREIKKLAVEMEVYKKEIKDIRAARNLEAQQLKAVRAELKEQKLDYVVMHGSKLTATLFQASVRISQQINDNSHRIEALQKKLLSEESIRSIAASVYTRGKTKRLNKELRKLGESKEKLAQEYASFKEMAEPKFYQLGYKKAYEEQKRTLEQRGKQLAEQESKLMAEKALLERELRKDGARKRLDSLENMLRTKNYVRENQISKLQKANKSLIKLGYSCLHLKNRVNDKIKYKLKREAIHTVKQLVIKDLQGSLDTIKNALNKARDEDVKGRMKVDLQVDVTNER